MSEQEAATQQTYEIQDLDDTVQEGNLSEIMIVAAVVVAIVAAVYGFIHYQKQKNKSSHQSGVPVEDPKSNQ